jgi:tetratricopeptide (TPR) repeat protein
MLSEPSLVGRDEQLSQLNSKLQQVTSGSGGFVLISGEAGIGKTRLATEFERGAVAQGYKVLFGGCLPSAHIPYLVFLDALNDLFKKASEKKAGWSRLSVAAKKAAPELLEAIPIFGATIKASAELFGQYREEGVAKEVSKEHVLFRTLELLRSESAKHPLVVHLDDLQWADSMSIAMLHFLARNCRDLRVMLLGTYRSEEILNKEGGIHPFLESIRMMKREGLVEELSLKPLGEKEVNQVVSGMMAGPVQEAVLERIFKESGGSPLFAVETVHLLVDSGALVLKDGRYCIVGPLGKAIPSSVKEVILRRIERMSKEDRKTLDYASVIGLSFDSAILAEALRKDHLLLLESLEHLESDHKLVQETESGYMFTHEKVRKFTYDGLSNLRKKEVHRMVGQILEKRLPNDLLYPELAVHFYSAKEGERAMKYSFLAGQFCLGKHAPNEAALFYKRVLELGTSVPGFEQYRLPAIEGLGDAGREGGMTPKERYSYYEQFLTLNEDRKAKARVLVKSAECWDQFGLGDVDMGMAFLNEAESCPEIEPLDLAMSELSKASFLYNDKRFDESLKPLAKAMVFFRETGNSFSLLEGMHLEVGILAWTYRLNEARDLAKKRYDEARKLGAPDTIMGSVIQLSHICVRRGETDSAITYATEGLGLAHKLASTHWLEEALIVRARAEEMKGNIELARRDAIEALESAREYQSPIHVVTITIDLALYESELRLLDQAEEHFQAAKEAFSMHSNETRQWMEGDFSILRAELLLARGFLQESDELFEKAIEMSNERGMLLDSLNSHLRYAVSLANRGNRKESQIQFNAAMSVAGRIGCEKRVQLLAKRVDIALDVC